MRKIHRSQLLTHKADLSVRTSGEASVIVISRFLPEKSSVLSILQPVVREVRVETSTILASADVLDANAAASLSELKSAVLKALHQHTKQELTHDDVTLIALQIC